MPPVNSHECLESVVWVGERKGRNVNRSRVSSEALKWVVWMKTSQSIDQRWPDFEKWLAADRKHWIAYLQARQEWSRWDRLELLLSQERRAVAKRLTTLEERRLAARRHREYLWIALGVAVLALLLA